MKWFGRRPSRAELERTYTDLMRTHQAMVFGMLRAGLQPEEVDDAYQKVSLALYRALEKGTVHNPPGLLRDITDKKIKDVYRRRKPTVSLDQAAAVAAPMQTYQGPPFEEILNLVPMDEEMRTVFRRIFIGRETLTAVAIDLEIKRTTLQSRYEKTLAALNKVYAKGGKP